MFWLFPSFVPSSVPSEVPTLVPTLCGISSLPRFVIMTTLDMAIAVASITNVFSGVRCNDVRIDMAWQDRAWHGMA